MVAVDVVILLLERIDQEIAQMFNDNKEHEVTIKLKQEELERINKAIYLKIVASPIITCGLPHDEYKFKKIKLPLGTTIIFEKYGEETTT